MSTLQRSSFSFRRQGSSGRVWDSRIQFSDIKPSATSSHDKSREWDFDYHSISSTKYGSVNSSASTSDPMASGSSDTEASHRGGRHRRRTFRSVCGCCAAPRTS